jgi:hypothetical protein
MNYQPRNRKGIGPKRGLIDREDDYVKMMMMLRRGMTQDMIAEELELSQSTVSVDLKVVLTRMKAQLTEDTKVYVAQKLAEYAEVKKEAWHAWERSKATYRRKRVRDAETGGFEENETTAQNGDKAYLETVLRCIAGERALLGLDAPKELQLQGKMQATTFDWSVLARGIPDDGEVPDEVEAEIQKVLALRPVAEEADETGVRPRKTDRPDSDAGGGAGH